MATLESDFPQALEAPESCVVATIRSDVNTFLEDLSNKLDCVTSSKTPPTKADVNFHLFQIVESAVRRRRNDCVPFNQLPRDVIHCVFAELLDLDRIYDHKFPIFAIEAHRKNLFKMRCVSTGWNDFLASSPRYWPAVNIESDHRMVERTIMRARDTPLILYTGEGWGVNGVKVSLVKEMLKEKYASQIAAIRVRGSGDEYFFWDLLRKGMTLLETLEVPWGLWPGGDKEPSRQLLTFELPRLRNLVAKRWEPLAAAPWLTDLQNLTLTERWGLCANTLRVLDTCVNLRELELGSRGWGDPLPEDDYSDVPTQIMLPKLRKLTLELVPSNFWGQLVRRLIIPPETLGFIRINDLPPPLSDDLNKLVEDLGQFIFLHAGIQWVVDETIFEIYWGYSPISGQSEFTYKVGCRWIALSQALYWTHQDQLVDIITNLQGLLHNPSLTLVVINHERCDTFLRKLADLGVVEKIRIKGRIVDIERALASIGSRRPSLPTGTTTDTDWPFESLKELVVEDLTLSIGRLLTLVGIRRPYLRSVSKTWLERISLINCQFTGMSVEQAVRKFAKLGVVLVGSGCKRAPRPK